MSTIYADILKQMGIANDGIIKWVLWKLKKSFDEMFEWRNVFTCHHVINFKHHVYQILLRYR